MDIETKQEFDDLKEKLNKIDGKIEKSTRDSNILTFAVVGSSIVLLGVAVWLQQGLLSSIGNFAVIYGGVIMVIMELKQKQKLTKKARWWVVISAIILLVILEVVKFLISNIPAA